LFRSIKNVIYEKKSILYPVEYFQLEIYEDKNVLKYSDNKHIDTIKGLRIENVEDEIVMQYFDELFRIIDGWKDKYQNNNFVDGIEWKLQITYKNGETKNYFGKNDFPNNFEYLDKIKKEMINKIIGE